MSNNMCPWHTIPEQIPLNNEQKMTKRSFLNYKPWKLGNLASFQLESNLYNAAGKPAFVSECRVTRLQKSPGNTVPSKAQQN